MLGRASRTETAAAAATEDKKQERNTITNHLAGDIAEQRRVETAATSLPPVLELLLQPLQRAHIRLP